MEAKMPPELEGAVSHLKMYGSIGFDGTTIRGLRVHPDGKHIVYPMGNKVIIQNTITKERKFLSGHTNTISAIDVSRSGKYIASGQINHIGFKASVILWDFETQALVTKYENHKVRVEAVAFSLHDTYLLSLGGRDCGFIVVWDIQQNKQICGGESSKGTQGDAVTLYTMNVRPECFATAGESNLQIWVIDSHARSVQSFDVSLRKLKRHVLCLDVNERDEIAFCGTATGDILKLRLHFHHDPEVLAPVKSPMMLACFTKISTKRLQPGVVELWGLGVRSIILLKSGELIIGAGDGSVDLIKEGKPQHVDKNLIGFTMPSIPALIVLKSTQVKSSVTSLQLTHTKDMFLAGTQKSEVFLIDLKTFTPKLIVTCHTDTIFDIAFPHNFSEVFATASKDNVRIWSMKSLDELLRIMVPNFSCSKIVFTRDGKSILTGWNDGVIRSFTPLTGRLIFAIMNAHNKGVSALDVTNDGSQIISGGCEGQVRIWNVKPTSQTLLCTLKEHKGPVSEVNVNHAGDEAVSASTDGTCIIWDIIRQCRKQIIFENTLFMTVHYHTSDVQILTGGSDRNLCYWEVLDGSLVREIEGSTSGAVNSLSISKDGNYFVSGGNDQIIKLWKYEEGVTTHIGLGHCSVVTCVCFSPDAKYVVSTGGAGEIFIWKVPQKPTEQPSMEKIELPKAASSERVVARPKEEHIENLESSRSSIKPCECYAPCEAIHVTCAPAKSGSKC